ncbi:alpha/beta fold hydrolase [Sneathiella marina]|uniref:Alpha/beta fold hydrolase n=1 Tax=Sneathiella marina TaxID=2950108 RepID=A0ABY4W2C9_9PROT|nr:alpha/beta hydrolase [Sneathiella marina]USG61326.1 alpha/beta fold hydrolase [Sneathiella marina]
MSKVKSNGLVLEYETFGTPSDPAIILVAGLGFQLIDWPLTFCKRLAENGFFVLRFDNRDIGLSQKLEEMPVPDLVALGENIKEGTALDLPYILTDMMEDVVGILDALSIDTVHLIGMSMGGMIAQLVAIHYPERLNSLTSIMSSSGSSALPPPSAAATTVLMSAPASEDLSDVVAFGLNVNDVIGSPGYRWNREELTDHIRACVERCYYPAGYVRQYAAVFGSPSRASLLPSITTPTLVIHGTEDPLVLSEAGKETARLIPDAQLELVEGMGHDLSPALCEHLADLILPHIKAS